MNVDTQNAPAPDSPEYHEHMAKMAQASSSNPIEDYSVKPTDDTNNNSTDDSSPSGLPEGFSSIEELIADYNKLKNPEVIKEEEAPVTEAPKEEQAEEKKPLDIDKYVIESIKDGSLSKESVAELEKSGIPPHLVNDMVTAQLDKSMEDANRFVEEMGGKERYDEFKDWINSLDESSMDANEARLYKTFITEIGKNNVDTALLAAQQLGQYFEAAVGVDGEKITGINVPNTGDVYGSIQEYVRDAQKDEYTGKNNRGDPSFQKKVADKLIRSKLF